MSIAHHHNEWLNSLVPSSGPFVSLPVIVQAFPQGLDKYESADARQLRIGYEEWRASQKLRPDAVAHRRWIRFILAEVLGYGPALREGQDIAEPLRAYVAEQGETLRPDFVVIAPGSNGPARVLVQAYPKAIDLGRALPESRWKASPETRMAQLLHDTGVRLGLCTNGEHFVLVHAARNETTGFAYFSAELWQEEPLTLRAFRSLLGASRLFGVADKDTLESLYVRSAEDQHEVTDQLGYQVRRAVEVLIQALDKADQDHSRNLLANVDAKVLYEAALTVMMRLVFLFCAEERELLLLGDDLYDSAYAVSTLREQLRTAADQHGEEILGLRYDAWARLLATFRAVYGGIQHERVKLPAYGGNLFSPDRFPFLEGRAAGTTWQQSPATPLPISNRTVLHLLESLQILQVRLPGGGATEARRLSFRALEITQIGHVYEGLLDHTAVRATEPIVGLAGTREKEPEIALAELQRQRQRGDVEFLSYLHEQTGRSESALQKALRIGDAGGSALDAQLASRLRTACGADDVLLDQLLPFVGLLRIDTYGYPVVITPSSVYVTAGTDRRSSGTHYTPKSLTEPIVEHTLVPLCFLGPAEGMPRAEWRRRRAHELLDLKVCDLACGSGAFLVEACRYLAARLQEAWDDAKKLYPGAVHITPFGEPSSGRPGEQLLPEDARERETYALRLVAQRCLYGVDKNPLAAEMAKLSLWLLTLAKDKPFEFLDHAIRTGDSLVGIRSLAQLRTFSMDQTGGKTALLAHSLDDQVRTAAQSRQQLESAPANSIDDVAVQAELLKRCDGQLARLRVSADWMVAAELASASAAERQDLRDRAVIEATKLMNGGDLQKSYAAAAKLLGDVTPFHWPLEFPEVLVERDGFDAFVGNPPFTGGLKISTELGQEYLSYIKNYWSHEKGRCDIVAYFLLRAVELGNGQSKIGLIATKTLSQGGTKKVGLAYLLEQKKCLYRTETNRPWPGTAGVHICVVHLSLSAWNGPIYLDDQVVSAIGADFEAEQNRVFYKLKQREIEPSMGMTLMGQGFILTASEAASFIAADPKNQEVIRPYLNGEVFNAHPEHKATEFAIDFQDWPAERCMSYHLPWQRIVEQVKPFREQPRQQAHESRFWVFEERRQQLLESLNRLKETLALSLVSKHLALSFVSVENVLSTSLGVIPTDCRAFFANLQSSIHAVWVQRQQYSLKGDPRYSLGDCYKTFVLADLNEKLENLGRAYFDYRRRIMIQRSEGLTVTYNRFHDKEERSEDIGRLRKLHEEMDYAVAAAYGWADLPLGHGFHTTKQGSRYTLTESARSEVLARLLRLNHERYEDEVRRGLHDKDKKKAKEIKAAAAPTSAEGTVAGMAAVDSATPVPAASKKRGRPAGSKNKSEPDPSGGAQGSLF